MFNQYCKRFWDAYFFEFGNVGVERDELPESWLSGFILCDLFFELIEVFGLDKDPKRTKIIYVFTEASERKTYLFYFLLTSWWEFDDPEPMSNRHTGAGNLINADTADSEADSLLPLKCAMFRLQIAGWLYRQTHPQSACPGAIAEWTLTWRLAQAGSPNTETEYYLPLIGYNRTESLLLEVRTTGCKFTMIMSNHVLVSWPLLSITLQFSPWTCSLMVRWPLLVVRSMFSMSVNLI